MEDKSQVLREGAKGLRALAEVLEMTADVLRTQNMDTLFSPKDIQGDLFVHQDMSTKENQEEIIFTLTDVRKILAEKSRLGYTDQVRLLLEKYGADKLSSIDPSQYKELVDEAKGLGVTLDELKTLVEQIHQKGLTDWVSEVLEHHFATSLEDLHPSYYPSFYRDLRSVPHE